MRTANSSVVLEAPDGSGREITLWTSGSVILHDALGNATDLEALIEARGVWVEDLGGTDEQFQEAVSYLDSIR